MKKQLITAFVLLVAAGVIGGCSGGGSSGSSPDGLSKSTVSGTVADGYLQNATVFLDKNSNYILDAGEPSAVTDATGAYTLNIDAADVGKYPIVALAIAGKTVDLDNPGAPIATSYVLSMHGVSITPSASGATGTVSNFISPISTQVREMIESGKYKTAQEASEALRTQMGLPVSSRMTEDYIKNRDNDMHSAAQNMAAVMGAETERVMSGGKVDIARYRGMIGSIFQNMSSVKKEKGHLSDDRISHDIEDSHDMPVYHQFSSMYRSRTTGGTTPPPVLPPTPPVTPPVAEAACGSCHAIPPAVGRHATHTARSILCGTCHGTGYSSTTVNAATHKNGSVDLSSTPGWNATTRSCSNSCHGSRAW